MAFVNVRFIVYIVHSRSFYSFSIVLVRSLSFVNVRLIVSIVRSTRFLVLVRSRSFYRFYRSFTFVLLVFYRSRSFINVCSIVSIVCSRSFHSFSHSCLVSFVR